MRVQTIRFDDRRRPRPRDKIGLGFEGDNLVERLEFILPQIAEAQTAQLMMGGKYANAVLLQCDGETYYADLTTEIVGTDGEVEAYVQINGSGGEAWHSDVMLLITGALPDVDKEIETRFPTAVETMLSEIAGHRAEMSETLGEAQAAADRAEDAVVNPPIVGSNGNWWLWDFEVGQYVDSGKPSQGGGATYHSQLMGRDADNQHPINAIAGLRKELDGLGYTLPPATPDTLGGMMVGDGLVADEDGRVSVEPEPDYALITTIEGKEGEEVGVIELDTTPDGKPYAFSAIRVEYVCYNTEKLRNISARFYYTNSEFTELTLGMSSMSPGAVAEHNAIVDHGMLSVTQTYWSNNAWTANARQAQPRRYLIGDKKICKVMLNKGDYFDGLTLRIQGRV